MSMRRKTYSEAMIEDLNRQINHWQEQARLLKKERDDEKRRYDALTIQFERMAKEVEEKNGIIERLTDKMLAMKSE